MPRVQTTAEPLDGKNQKRNDFLTSFPTDPFESTSPAIQDTEALKRVDTNARALVTTKSCRFLEDKQCRR